MQDYEMIESARSSNDSLTLVLMTHNRPKFLHRALHYYSKFGFPIMVLDSSAASALDGVSQFHGIDYHHVPQFTYSRLQAKLKYGVALVKTEFMVFVAVDDFLLYDALTESVAFLQANPDYGLCHGYGLMYVTHADDVKYFRRECKVTEDYASDVGQDRALAYMSEFIPPFYAVGKTSLVAKWLALLPEDIGFEWMEVSHVYCMLSEAKARILPIPYAVREGVYFESEHKTNVLDVLDGQDQKTVAARQFYAELFATHCQGSSSLDWAQRVALAQQSFKAMSDCIRSGRSLDVAFIFNSHWVDVQKGPERRFKPVQYVEMPFYNKAFFDCLAELEFLMHAFPAGSVQLEELEGVWTRQDLLLQGYANDTTQTIVNRLWQAIDLSVFNRRVASQLAQQLTVLGETETASAMAEWVARLDAAGASDYRALLAETHSGQMLDWLQARRPAPEQAAEIQEYLGQQGGGPEFGILLLDLENDRAGLQVTLDSLVEGCYKGFKITIFTTGEPPVVSTPQDVLHFIKVSKTHYVEKVNRAVSQSNSSWILLAEVGDQFTASGLARAALELMKAPGCRAIVADEVHRHPDGTLTSAFRPGFNLDILQSAPALMARHWLVRRDVVVAAGGYSANFNRALEFDLLLRIVESDGMGWLAHLDEPLLTVRAPVLEDNPHERQALLRHLANRGYQALLTSETPGLYRVDYRHSQRPLVSVILPCQDNLVQLQACLEDLRLRTRYVNYEVLVVDNASQDHAMEQWLERAEEGWPKLRILRSEQPSNLPALYNAASQQAKGEFLVLLDSDAKVISPNWIESLLNHAQRPEVGIVGAKLLDDAGNVTQGGLILGFAGGVGVAFAGTQKDAPGYLQRLVVDQNYSAVSGACLMIGSALFQGVGGLDDDMFGESLSDVDLCLKVGQAGYLVVWTPYAQVNHPGEVVQTPNALAGLRSKWPGVFGHDLAYNRNLSQGGTSFTLGAAASVDWAPLLG